MLFLVIIVIILGRLCIKGQSGAFISPPSICDVLQEGDPGDSARVAGPGALLGSIPVGQELFQPLSPDMLPKQHFSHLPVSSLDLF